MMKRKHRREEGGDGSGEAEVEKWILGGWSLIPKKRINHTRTYHIEDKH
jgi:hypothetical protein